MKFSELEDLYKQHFSIGYMGKNLDSKLALISLICYVVYKSKEKKPGVTYYQVITQISKGIGLTEDQICALAIICEYFGYGCEEFPTFGLKGKEIVSKIKELLASEMPF